MIDPTPGSFDPTYAVERTIRPLQRATDANNAKADVLARYANRWRVGYSPADDVPELILFLRSIDGRE